MADVGTYQSANTATPAVADGDPVRMWADQSGNGNGLSQGTSSKRPLLKLAVKNGLPVVRFDGVDDFLQKAFTLAQPTHVVAVVCQRTWVGGNRLFDGFTSNNAACYDFTASPGVGLYAGGAQGPACNDLAVGSFGLLEALFDGGAASTITVNAGTAVTETGPGSASANGITLASTGAGGNSCALDVGEFLVFNATVSGASLTSLRSYLNGRWSLY